MDFNGVCVEKGRWKDVEQLVTDRVFIYAGFEVEGEIVAGGEVRGKVWESVGGDVSGFD